MLDEVFGAIWDHHRFIESSIPLIASENITSRAVRLCYMSDLGHRYAIGDVGDRMYCGCEYIDRLENMAIKLTKEIFKAEHVNVRPISGTIANIAVYFALTNCGDKIFALRENCGGHTSHDFTAKIRDLEVCYLPFDSKTFNINVDAARRKIVKERPRLIILGASLFLFPHPVREIAEIAQEVGAKVVYDASHVLGLIAGKQFQDPIREGADVVTASTHKTFPGPQRAVIMCKKELADSIDRAVMPGVVSNHHIHSLAGYVVACLEMMEFGEAYAKQIVKNAKRLAERLFELGFDVLCPDLGFTESHQVAVDVSKLGGGDKVAKILEKAGILTNKTLLPWDTDKPSGIRIGVQEVTRLGMKEDEMDIIAELISRAIKEPKKVRKEVSEFKRKFRTVKFAFEESPAYEVIV